MNQGMPRKVRLEYAGACYHVINRGNYRRDLFGEKGALDVAGQLQLMRQNLARHMFLAEARVDNLYVEEVGKQTHYFHLRG